MADVQVHIDRIREQCCQLQEHGHCDGNPPAFVAISDLEIRLQDFVEAIAETEDKQ
jgi:hypothetical protein